MRIWLVEDDGFKRQRISAFLSEMLPECEIFTARSAKTALNLVVGDAPDLVILDMSLPTFDIGPGESGGRPQGFGGVEVLREMDRRSVRAPVIVVTQYEVFESGSERIGLKELSTKLQRDHPHTFQALVYYETSAEEWKERLAEKIDSVFSSSQGSHTWPR